MTRNASSPCQTGIDLRVLADDCVYCTSRLIEGLDDRRTNPKFAVIPNTNAAVYTLYVASIRGLYTVVGRNRVFNDVNHMK